MWGVLGSGMFLLINQCVQRLRQDPVARRRWGWYGAVTVVGALGAALVDVDFAGIALMAWVLFTFIGCRLLNRLRHMQQRNAWLSSPEGIAATQAWAQKYFGSR